MSKKILVSGITGRQGFAVASKLKEAGWEVKGLTRTPDRPNSLHLKEQGFEMVKGDMADINSLKNAMKNCYGVFSLQNYWEYGKEKEFLFGKNMAQAAKDSDVKHFVFGSCQSCDRNTGVEHFDSKFDTEKFIKSIDLPATILRPVAFMENYYIKDVYTRILKGKLSDPLSKDKKFQLIATEDIGNYVTAVFNNPKLIGETIDIVGDETTNQEVTETLSRVMGQKMKFQKMPMFLVKIILGKEFYIMFNWLEKYGFNADKSRAMSLIPEVKPMNLETWLLKEGFNRWNKKGKF